MLKEMSESDRIDKINNRKLEINSSSTYLENVFGTFRLYGMFKFFRSCRTLQKEYNWWPLTYNKNNQKEE